MKLECIVTMASAAVRLRFLAMERSLRAVGCTLPLRVIPYNDERFELPAGATWWEMPEITTWLARQGARHLALLGRGEPSPAAREAIAELQKSGVRVLPLRGDVADPDDVAAALASIDAELPALRGVFHLAGLLADATLPQLDGSVLEVETDGLLARALQHEIEHLNGVLFVDRLPAVTKVAMKNRLKKLLDQNPQA